MTQTTNKYNFGVSRARLVFTKSVNDVEAYMQLRFESPQTDPATVATSPGKFENVNRLYVTVKNVGVKGLNLSLGKILYQFGNGIDIGNEGTAASSFAGSINGSYGLGMQAQYKLPDMLTAYLTVTNGNGKTWEDNNTQKMLSLYADVTPIGPGLNLRAGYATNVPNKTNDVGTTVGAAYTGDVKNIQENWINAEVFVTEAMIPNATVGAEVYMHLKNNFVKSDAKDKLDTVNKTGIVVRGSYTLDAFKFMAGYNILMLTLPEKVTTTKGIFGNTINYAATDTAEDKKLDKLNGSVAVLAGEYKIDNVNLGLEYRMMMSDKKEFFDKVEDGVTKGKELANKVLFYANYTL